MIYELEPHELTADDHAFLAGVLKGAASERRYLVRWIERLADTRMLSQMDADALVSAIHAGEHLVMDADL